MQGDTYTMALGPWSNYEPPQRILDELEGLSAKEGVLLMRALHHAFMAGFAAGVKHETKSATLRP